MSYLVFCTFDLKNATRQNYQDVYDDLALLGLDRVQVGSNGASAVIPTTSVMGQISGASAVAVRDYVASEVQAMLGLRNLSSEIFLTVGDDWAWASRVT